MLQVIVDKYRDPGPCGRGYFNLFVIELCSL